MVGPLLSLNATNTSFGELRWSNPAKARQLPQTVPRLPPDAQSQLVDGAVGHLRR